MADYSYQDFISLFKMWHFCTLRGSILTLYLHRTVQDFDDWTTWLLYKGGIGVKAEESWETWWDEEQVNSFIFLCVSVWNSDQDLFVHRSC